MRQYLCSFQLTRCLTSKTRIDKASTTFDIQFDHVFAYLQPTLRCHKHRSIATYHYTQTQRYCTTAAHTYIESDKTRDPLRVHVKEVGDQGCLDSDKDKRRLLGKQVLECLENQKQTQAIRLLIHMIKDRVDRNGLQSFKYTMNYLFLQNSSVNTHASATYVCFRALKQSKISIDRIPTDTLTVLLSALHRWRRYDDILYIGKHITKDNIDGQSAQIILMALRRLQDEQIQKEHSEFRSCKKLKKNRILDSKEHAEPHCDYRKLAHHIVRILALQNSRALGPGHLSKVLEIDLASVPQTKALPRQMHIWLELFVAHRVNPDVFAMTMLMNAYMDRGDEGFAMWIYEQMQSGKMILSRSYSSVDVLRVLMPKPNLVTDAVTARAWVRSGQFDRIEKLVRELKSDVKYADTAKRLVARVVSHYVDCGDVAEAHAYWQRHRESAASLDNSPDNFRVLAKLALGYAKSGNVLQALDLFNSACQSATNTTADPSHITWKSSTKKTQRGLHFTSVFNAILNASLVQPRGCPHRVAASELILAADRNGVRLDSNSYNILFSRLSAIAAEKYGSEGAVRKTAEMMQELYLDMVKRGVDLDDMTLCQLMPMWKYIGMDELALVNWQYYTEGYSVWKMEQMKRHLFYSSKRWKIKIDMNSN